MISTRPAPRAEAATGEGHVEQLPEDGRRGAQIPDGLEEGDDADVERLGAEAGMAGEKVDAEQVVGAARHRQDEGADGLGVGAWLAHQAQQRHQLGRLGAQQRGVHRGEIGRGEIGAQPGGPVRRAGLGRGGAGDVPDLAEHAGRDGGVLAQVQRHRPEPEDLGAPADGADLAAGEAPRPDGLERGLDALEIGGEGAEMGVAAIGEALAHARQGLAEGLVRIALRLGADDAPERGAMRLGQRADAVADAEPGGRRGEGPRHGSRSRCRARAGARGRSSRR